jgi:IclR family pca regulon transcriptional regulator
MRGVMAQTLSFLTGTGPSGNMARPMSGQRLERPADHVQALTRGLRILEHVYRAGVPVAVREVAEALELNVSTAHHLVNTLVWEGYLVRGADRRLTPGRAPAFGRPGAAGPPALWRALGRAAYAADDVALLSRLDGGEACISANVSVPGAPSEGRYPAGTRYLAHLVAAGRVLLAWQDPDAAANSLEHAQRVARERREIFDEAAICEDLERIRAQRFATLVSDGHGCVAVPVFDSEGTCVAAVAIVVASRRVRRDLERLVAVGRSSARGVSEVRMQEARREASVTPHASRARRTPLRVSP